MRIPRLVTLLAVAPAFAAWSLAGPSAAYAQQPAPAATIAPKPAAPAAAVPPPSAPGEVTYEKWTKDADKQPGLFTLWRKDGKVYMELNKDQLGKEYYEHATTANGLGGYGFYSGDDFQQEARIVKFVRIGPKAVAVVWPQIRFESKPGTAIENAVRGSTADSIQAVAPIATEDKENGKIVLDASFLLADNLDGGRVLSETLERNNPLGAYRLDPTKTYFGPTKAFPKNVLIEADQTFVSAKPQTINTVVEPRSIQARVKYNFAEILATPGYMPRLEDDRVGFWDDPHIQFDKDNRYDNLQHYILRWGLQATDPSRPSPAQKPLVYTLTNTIPERYRPAIRDAILEWNKAFARIGILNAVQVVDQPTDPNWDPDDIRYNTIRWLTEANGGGFAEAQIEWDPRTGEIFRGGVLIDSDIMRFGKIIYGDLVGPVSALDPDPASPLSPSQLSDTTLWDPAKVNPAVWGFAPQRRHGFLHRDSGMLAQAQYGALALQMYGENVPPSYDYDFLKAIIMHEIGHDFGLGHNFIGHNSFTASQLKNKSYTHANGVASSVMEYAPINLWPKGSPRGDLFQATLGSYDYHVIRWGYAPIPGAKTPDDEVSTLSKWASAASDPRYAFASDEDVAYNGHAVDPRVAQNMLTNDSIGWCETQLGIERSLMGSLDSRYPKAQQRWEQERFAFLLLFNQYNRCANAMTHYVAGEYLSRGRPGDRGVKTALTPLPRSEEVRAFRNLDRYIFAENAIAVSPQTLNRLVYTEFQPFADFYYDPTARHDVSLTSLANAAQYRALSYMFSTLVLQRLNDMPTKAAPGATMSLADLFDWTQTSVFGDLANGRTPKTAVRRNLQRTYARFLARMAVGSTSAVPLDAQALARHELVALGASVHGNLMRGNLDLQTRSHLEALQSEVTRALDARNVIPI